MSDDNASNDVIVEAIRQLHEHWREWDRKLYDTFVNGGEPNRSIVVDVPEILHRHPTFEECQPGDEAARMDVASGAYEAVRKLQLHDHVIDIGAHVGHFTRRALDVGATVNAIEPDPRNFRMLSRLLVEPLGLYLRLWPVAASDHEGIVELQRSLFSTQHHLNIRERWLDVYALPAVRIPCMRVDQLSLPATFIKIDVEEAELAVLRGLQDTIRHFHPFITIEVTADMDACAEFLRQFGYTIQASTHMHLPPAPMEDSIAGLWHCTHPQEKLL